MIRERRCVRVLDFRTIPYCPLPRFQVAAMPAGASCEACTCRRSKISGEISSRKSQNLVKSSQRSRLLRVGSESFFLLERKRRTGEMACRCRYARASVFDRRQKFCESGARSDGVAELTISLKLGRQTERARNKSLWTHLGSCWCISHVKPSRSSKKFFTIDIW